MPTLSSAQCATRGQQVEAQQIGAERRGPRRSREQATLDDGPNSSRGRPRTTTTTGTPATAHRASQRARPRPPLSGPRHASEELTPRAHQPEQRPVHGRPEASRGPDRAAPAATKRPRPQARILGDHSLQCVEPTQWATRAARRRPRRLGRPTTQQHDLRDRRRHRQQGNTETQSSQQQSGRAQRPHPRLREHQAPSPTTASAPTRPAPGQAERERREDEIRRTVEPSTQQQHHATATTATSTAPSTDLGHRAQHRGTADSAQCVRRRSFPAGLKHPPRPGGSSASATTAGTSATAEDQVQRGRRSPRAPQRRPGPAETQEVPKVAGERSTDPPQRPADRVRISRSSFRAQGVERHRVEHRASGRGCAGQSRRESESTARQRARLRRSAARRRGLPTPRAGAPHVGQRRVELVVRMLVRVLGRPCHPAADTDPRASLTCGATASPAGTGPSTSSAARRRASTSLVAAPAAGARRWRGRSSGPGCTAGAGRSRWPVTTRSPCRAAATGR